MEPIQEQDLRRVVETYSHMLLRVAMTRVPTTADAEDVVQDVFLRLMTHSPRFRDGEHEKAWLIRATLQRVKDICRAKARQNVPLEEAGEVAAAVSEEGVELLSAVQALPEKYSTVIHLYYYEGYSVAEVAGLLGKSQGTVKSRLFRARKLLRAQLEGEKNAGQIQA